MKRLFVLSLLFFIFNYSGLAQKRSNAVHISMAGKITDAETGEPLHGASILLADDKIGTISNQEGKYFLDHISPGHHVIEVSYVGFATVVVHVDINQSMQKDFSLQPEIVENRGVVVTGVASATSIRQSPAPLVAVKKQALLQTPSSNIIDALTHVPGISQVSTGPAISKPIIRGLGANRVVVINNGVRQEGQQWGDEHGIAVDEMSVQKAEIVKGPASLMYGSDALAGVIHFMSNVPVAEGTMKGHLLSNFQSNNNLLALNGGLAGNKNGINWNLYGSYKKAGNYQNKFDGKVLNSGFNEKNMGGYFGINKSWGFSHLIFSRFDQRLGIIEGDRDDATGKFILYAGTPAERIATNADLHSQKLFVPQQQILHNKIVSDNNFVVGKNRLKAKLGYQQNIRKEFGHYENPKEAGLYFDLKTFNFDLQWQWHSLKDWHTTIGLSGMQQSNKNKGEEMLIPAYNLFDIGGFIFTQRTFKKTTFSGGLRYDNRHIDSKAWYENGNEKFADFQRSFGNFSGSAGISFAANKAVILKINLAKGFRSPTLAELASNGAHEGTNRYEYGSRNLQSENSWQLDGGLDVDTKHFSFSLSAFHNQINHFIFYQKLKAAAGGDSLVMDAGDWIPAYQFDQQNAKLYGFETSFDLHPHPLHWLHFENSFSFVRGQFKTAVGGSRNLPLMPAARFTSELKADVKNLNKFVRNFYALLSWEKTFRQHNPFTGFGTETETKGYGLLNAGMGGDILNHDKTLFTIYFGVTNITDKAYQSHLSRLKYTDMNQLTGRVGVFNPGRNFSVKVNIPLRFKI